MTAEMNALVANAENYLHVGGDQEERMNKLGGFNNSNGMDDSFCQVSVTMQVKNTHKI